MKIQGIKLIEPRPAVGGYIKIGRTVAGRNERGAYTRPEKHDHFEITTTWREGADADNLEVDTELLERVLAIGGDDLPRCDGCERAKALGFPEGLPRRLPIYLASDELTATFPHWLAYYRGRTRYCHGDGEQAERLQDGKGPKGEPIFVPPAQPYGPCGTQCPDLQARRCKPQGILRVCLGVQQRVGTVFEFRTTSWNSIRNLLGSLEWVRAVTGGVVQFIPLFLDLTPITVKPPDRAPSRAWVVTLSYPGSPAELARAAVGELGAWATQRQQLTTLVARIDATPESPDVAAAVEAEFYAGDGEAVDLATGEVLPQAAPHTPAAPVPQSGPSPAPATSTLASPGYAPEPAAEDRSGAPIEEGAATTTPPSPAAPAAAAPTPAGHGVLSLDDALDAFAQLGVKVEPKLAQGWTLAQRRQAYEWAQHAYRKLALKQALPDAPVFLAELVRPLLDPPAGFEPAPAPAPPPRRPRKVAPKAEAAPSQPALPVDAPAVPGERGLNTDERRELVKKLKGAGLTDPVAAIAFLREKTARFDINGTGDLRPSDLAKVDAAIELLAAGVEY